MKKFLTYFSVIAATVVVTLILSSALQPTAIAAPGAPVVSPAQPIALATPDRHPHIDEAIEHLRAAKHELETAEKDFGGHRVKAIEHVNQAIREGEICMTMP